MKRFLTLVALVAVGGIVAVPSNGAQTITVTLTATGPQPPVVNVQWGDTVTFVNGDTVSHDITSTDQLIANKTLGPGESYSVTFTGSLGRKSYVEVAKPRSFYGPSVSVGLNGATISLNTKTPTVVYGKPTQLTGKVGLPGAQVVLQSQPLNQYGNALGEWQPVGAPVTAGGDGSFAFQAKPVAGTAYRAAAAAGQLTSQMVKVFVVPQLTLKAPKHVRVGSQAKLTIVVSPAKATTGVDLEAFSTKFGRWLPVSHLHVARNGRIVTSWTVVPGRTKLRAAIPQEAAAPGVSAVTSLPSTVVGT